jgi:hypothetical protein
MESQKKKQDDYPRQKPAVVIRTSVMTREQEQRLSTAVDALLAEWVRQELSRAKNQP